MSWSAAMSANASTYTQKWTYALKDIGSQEVDTLNAGCPIDMHGFALKSANLRDARWNGYSGITRGVPIVTSISDNGDGTISWTYGTLDVRSGGIVAAPS